MPKRMLICGTCGSDHIVRDAWAFWSLERQEWELSDIFDHAFCLTCEDDCTIEEAPAQAPSSTLATTNHEGNTSIMTAPKQRPDFQAYTTRKRPDGQKDIWIDIGAGFLHQDGAEINVILQATPIDGRVILRPMPDGTPTAKRE